MTEEELLQKAREVAGRWTPGGGIDPADAPFLAWITRTGGSEILQNFLGLVSTFLPVDSSS